MNNGNRFKLKRNFIVNKRFKAYHMLMESILNEINEYNKSYWSKYLFWSWITFGTVISTLTYQTLFGKMSPITRSIFLYLLTLFIFIFAFLANTASSVALEVKKSLIIMSNLSVSHSCHRGLTTLNRIKVFLYNTII
jgi:hypothetical protein